jgi:sigma-E factor negative regulatory protein RseC
VLEESAVVVRIEQGLVWVVGTENSACAGCIQKAACSSTALASVLKKKPIPVDCDIALKIGDTVIVAIEETTVLRAAFSLYILPLIALFVGAGIADSLLNDAPYAELWIAVSAIASLGFALLLMHSIQKLSLFDYYDRPVVIKKC